MEISHDSGEVKSEHGEDQDALDIRNYNKTRDDLDEDEDSQDYWSHATGLIRAWRHHCRRKEFYEGRLQHVLRGSGIEISREVLRSKEISQGSSKSDDE